MCKYVEKWTTTLRVGCFGNVQGRRVLKGYFFLPLWPLGYEEALHTQAKCHNHEIMAAQKKASKGRSKAPSKSCSVVTHPQV